MNLNNKVALITGAAVGIGRATAILLAEKGASLVLVDIDVAKLEDLKSELSVYDVKILTFAIDVSDEAAVYEATDKAITEFGRIDILVNNAALWRVRSSFIDTPTSTWRKFIDINIMGVVYFTRAVLPSMLENKWGRVINVASVAGVYGNANMVHYSATKGAVIALTKALAQELGPSGIRVNCIAPGVICTDMCANVDPEIMEQLKEQTPVGRNGTPKDVADAMLYLADAEFVTGQVLPVNGGFVL